MNAKLVLALILTLQVSASLCDIPEPSPELVQKYNELSLTFSRRLENLFHKVANSPAVNSAFTDEEFKEILNYLSSFGKRKDIQAVARVAQALAVETMPQVKNVRNGALGVYGKYIRPVAKTHVEEFISVMKVILDKIMPAD
ncbi:uncharacterized protein ACB058_013261 [Synchiropus picturatus]